MKNIFKDRRFKYGSLATILTVVFVAVVVLINVVVSMITERFPMDVDLTNEKIFEISDETVNYIKNLKQEVKVTVLAKEEEFSGNNTYFNQANEVIQKYSKYTGEIKITYVDLYTNPDLAQKYPKESLQQGYIIVESGERHQILTPYQLFNTQVDQQSGSTYITSSKAEEAMTGAIMNVTNANPPTAVVLTGNGVTNVSGYTSMLEANGYSISETDLLAGELDADADMLILAAPMTDLSAEALKKLDDYLDNGGKFGKNLLYFASATQPDLPNLEEFLKEWGIVVGKGYLAETDEAKVYVMGPTYTIQQYGDEEYTKTLKSTDYPILLFASRPLESAFGEGGTASNREVVTLLKTYDSSVVVPPDLKKDSDWKIGDAKKASYATAMAGSRTKYEGMTPMISRVIAVGSVEFVNQSFLSYTAVNNGDYAVNMANIACGKEAALTIVPKKVGAKNLGITAQQTTVIGGLFQFVLPIVILITGCVVWIRRRNR